MLRIMLLCLSLAVAGSASAADDFVSKRSAHPVATTIDRLAETLKAKGINVVARIDHAAAAQAAGASLPPTQVLIFGNPALGTPLMQADPRIGLDLPMKVLAWQNAAGEVWLGYRAPEALAHDYGITSQDAVFAKMTAALGALTDAAVK